MTTATITERILSNTEAYEYLDQHLPALLGNDWELPTDWEPCLTLDEINRTLEDGPLPITCEQFAHYWEEHYR